MQILFAAISGNLDAEKRIDQYAKLVPVAVDVQSDRVVSLSRAFDNIDEAERFVDGFMLGEFTTENGGFDAIRGFADNNGPESEGE